MLKILNIAGARPNFMKIAPLIRVMTEDSRFEPKLIHTGQHYNDEMSKVFFDDLGIPAPDTNLEVGSGSREDQIQRIEERFEPVLLAEAPDAVLVVGDVNSTIACARIAKKHGIPVIHVEAGLRSGDLTMPEEVNRIETDKLSDYLFVTEPSGMLNIEAAGLPGRAYLVGNVMIDSLVAHLSRAKSVAKRKDLNLDQHGYFVGTFHRPSNVDTVERLDCVIQIIEFAASRLPIVVPLHPRTRNALEASGRMARLSDHKNIRLVDPLGYIDFLSLLADAKGIVTDSGGIQEETTFLQVPCITMRDNTERPITTEIGSNILAGTDPNKVIAAIEDVLSSKAKVGRIPDYWDGHTAERIVKVLSEQL